ncbi:MAG: protease SohB [Pseudomonadales bacterium]|nr:protease SohB [Pseudomonadales bacterium]MDP7145666.1 protease SohB [Pseudomonadales bacterium]MDP7360802.1 protease SohB [Pseudomonadales bacterium]MDP7594318.1 protease SohB [Pseudomonadales bacterium]HJN51373.1 protease SohB [Pseudomonadales bacterium]
MEFLTEYGLFLAKVVTIVAATVIVIIVLVAAGYKTRKSDQGHIEIQNLNENLKSVTHTLRQAILPAEVFKQQVKEQKQEEKSKQKELKKSLKKDAGKVPAKTRLYVLDFLGDMQASAVTQLREEITAVVSIATEKDSVLLRLESSGGLVHSYGLAASQLMRLLDKQISLTIAIDKVAASGGYMMACIGNKIMAAPFALLGSIGVIAQIPNFHRLLKKNDIDVDVLTAGEYKRTLTIFGENTEKGRNKAIEELEDVHTLFKNFVSEHRPQLDMDVVATGEAWYGRRALEKQLVDELKTSDAFIYEQCQECDVYHVAYVLHKSKMDRLFERISFAINSSLERLLVPFT